MCREQCVLRWNLDQWGRLRHGGREECVVLGGVFVSVGILGGCLLVCREQCVVLSRVLIGGVFGACVCLCREQCVVLGGVLISGARVMVCLYQWGFFGRLS